MQTIALGSSVNRSHLSGINEDMNECLPQVELANLISGALLRLRSKSPFFGTLAMFARFVPDFTIPSAATDGKDIFFNPDFLRSLSSQQQEGLLLHELLHAALLHPLRLGEREPQLWNIAADIVVNGTICRQSGLELPAGALRDENLEAFSVEEVYELLRANPDAGKQLTDPDLLAPKICNHESGGAQTSADCLDLGRIEELTAHWRNALHQSTAIARTAKSGRLPRGIDRELQSVLAPQLDWRSYLWRYLVQTPTDFQGFDRRLIGRGLYLEALESPSVKIYLAIDTSSSIRTPTLELFIGEVRGILGAYPHLECYLYYVDSEVCGCHQLTIDSPLPQPEGGGGTSFTAFFDRIATEADTHTPAVCIYLTDGYGEFPATSPTLPTLWIVTPGGLDLDRFPFGEAVRLI